MKKVSGREGRGGVGRARGTAGFGAGSSPLRRNLPGGEHRIPGAKGYTSGGRSLLTPLSLVIAGLAGGGALASALLQRCRVLEPAAARWVLYAGLILAGLVFFWEGRRRFGGDSRKKRGPGRRR